MNGKKLILVLIPIVVVILSIIFIQNQYQDIDNLEIIEEEIIIEETQVSEKTDEQIFSEISDNYEKIENNVEQDEFFTRDREWPTSGPFSIDRTEYGLGEKIFFKAEGILPPENGQIVFLRYLNETHYKVWTTYTFDGMKKNAFNIYFEPAISKTKNICDKDDLLVDWIITFRNTNYENLYFSIIDKIVPGDEEKFSKIVC